MFYQPSLFESEILASFESEAVEISYLLLARHQKSLKTGKIDVDVLIGQHSDGYWTFPGGKYNIEDTNPFITIVREFSEEVASGKEFNDDCFPITLTQEPPINFLSSKGKPIKANPFIGFLEKRDGENAVIASAEPEKIRLWEWMSIVDIKKLISEYKMPGQAFSYKLLYDLAMRLSFYYIAKPKYMYEHGKSSFDEGLIYVPGSVLFEDAEFAVENHREDFINSLLRG